MFRRRDVQGFLVLSASLMYVGRRLMWIVVKQVWMKVAVCLRSPFHTILHTATPPVAVLT